MPDNLDPSLVYSRKIQYWLIALVLSVSYFALLDVSWQGSVELHTLMESLATILALTTGFMAILRYYSQKDALYIYIGVAFLGTGLLDFYHAVVTSVWFNGFFPSGLGSLIPWSWTASRIFLALFLFISWYATRHSKLRLSRSKELKIYFWGAVMTLSSFIFFAFVPLPRAYFPELFFHRPEELVPGLLFAIALIGFLRQGFWKCNVFYHWLIICLIVSLVAQLVFMPLSSELFDMQFDVAHLLKKLSYIAALTGLMISMFYAYKRQEKEQEIIQQQAAELLSSHQKLEVVANFSTTWEVWTDPQGKIMFSSLFSEQLIGYTQEEIATNNIRLQDLLYKDEKLSIYKHVSDGHTMETEPLSDLDFRVVAKDGTVKWINHVCQPIFSEEGRFLGRRSSNRDITDRKEAEDYMKLLNLALEYSPLSLVITDKHASILYVNPKFTEITGYTLNESVGQKTSLLKSGEHPTEFYEELWHCLDTGFVWEGEIHNRKKNGQLFWAETKITPIFREDRGIQYFVALMEDITDKKKKSKEIFKRANYDYLTGIFNRIAFEEKADMAIARAKRKDEKIALLVLDLDNFKPVNDTYGHQAGDELLKMVTQRIKHIIRETDVFGRLGGDEFCILLEMNDQELSNIGYLCERIIASIKTPFILDKVEVYISCSIGVALYPDDSENFNDLFRKADSTLYQVKEQGRNAYRFFSNE